MKEDGEVDDEDFNKEDGELDFDEGEVEEIVVWGNDIY